MPTFINEVTPMNDAKNLNDTEGAVLDFLFTFENVFGPDDWDYTRMMLAAPSATRKDLKGERI